MGSRSEVAARRSSVDPIQILAGLAIALGFGAATVFGLSLSIPVPVYVPLCSPCIETINPNILKLPAFVLALYAAAAIAYGKVARGQVTMADLGRGVSAGVVAVLGASLILTATLAFSDPYIGWPYRLYAAVAVLGVTALLSAWVGRRSWRSGQPEFAILVALPLLGALTVAAASVGVRGHLTLGAIALFGVGSGIAISRSTYLDWLIGASRRLTTGQILAGVMVVAFLLRAVFGLQALLRLGPGMAFALASDDGPSYYAFAHNIYQDPAAVGAVLSNAAGFPPIYSLFLALIFVLTRENLAVVVLVQAAFAAIAVFLLYLLASDLFGRAAGLIAAALFALSQNLIQNEATLTPESLLVPFILGALYSAGRYQRSAQIRWLLATALLLALAFITRNLIFLLTIAILGWLLMYGQRKPKIWLRDVAAVLLLTVVAASPVALATYSAEGAPRPTNQLAALGWDYISGTGLVIENGYLVERGIEPFRDPVGTAVRFASDPIPVVLFYASAVPQRISALLYFPDVGLSDPMLLVNPARYPSPFGQMVELLLVLAMVVGSTVLLRASNGRQMVVLFVIYLLLYLALFAFVFPPRQAYRYRIPIEPLLLLAEAVGLVVMARHATGLWRRPTAPSAPDRAPGMFDEARRRP